MGIAAPASDEVAAHESQSVDQLLDWGAQGGIAYFMKFYPLYLELCPSGRSLSDIEARYNEQRGMNLAKLAGTRDALSSALGEAQTQQYTQQNCAIRLQSVWSGGATAGTAHQMAADQVRLAGNDIQAAQAAVAAIGGFIDAARSAVTGKALTVRNIADFDGDNPKMEIRGRSPDDIQTMIDIRGAKEWVSSNQINSLNRWFPDRNLLNSTNNTEGNSSNSLSPDGRNDIVGVGVGHEAQVAANFWLDIVFIREVERKLGIFDTVCAEADADINAAYKLVTDALMAVHDTRYPRPAAAQANPTLTAPGNTATSPGNTTTNTGATTSSAGTTPASTGNTTSSMGNQRTPASLFSNSSPSNTSTDLGSTLAGLASQASSLTSTATSALNGLGPTMNTLVTQGQSAISALSGEIQQGISGVLGGTTAAKGAADKPVAEFDVAGKHLRLELGTKGGLALNLTDSSGENKTYTLTLDEHGVPVIITEDQSPSASSPDASSGGQSQGDQKPSDHGTTGTQYTNQSPGGNDRATTSSDPGKPTNRGADSEPKAPSPPAPSPAAPTPAAPTQPFDSGAELPEVGPL